MEAILYEDNLIWVRGRGLTITAASWASAQEVLWESGFSPAYWFDESTYVDAKEVWLAD